MAASFIHLRVHSEFSLADGIVRLEALVEAARGHNMPAVALTDLGNVFGVVKFQKAAVAAGIKPLVGADLWVANPVDPNKPFRLTALCQDLAGYRSLCALLTRAYAEGQHAGRACVTREWLQDTNDGLLVLSGAHEGDVGQMLLSGNVAAAESLAGDYAKWFPGRYYLELQRTGQPFQEDYNHLGVKLGMGLGLPVVATNPVMFLVPEEYDAHEVRVCIQDGRVLTDMRRPRRYTSQQYFRSSEEMAGLFADIPEAIENTFAIAQRCNFALKFGTYHLPAYPVPSGTAIDEVLRANASTGLSARLEHVAPDEHGRYRERMELELGVIVQMGFAGYFLIVADFIQWARANGVPVGPGRGSGAGSLVAWCLGITALDPIKYELLFERFLNPE